MPRRSVIVPGGIVILVGYLLGTVESIEDCFDSIFMWDVEIEGFYTSIVARVQFVGIGVLSNMDMRWPLSLI